MSLFKNVWTLLILARWELASQEVAEHATGSWEAHFLCFEGRRALVRTLFGGGVDSP